MPRKIIKSKFMFENDLIETMGEVPIEDYKPWESNDKLKIVGKPVSRIDGYDKVSGTAQYTFDKEFANMAYARTLRCPFPNATIKSINISKANELPGVLSILTHENTPKIKWYYNTSFLFDPHLRYQGDEIACVAAESIEIAEKALSLIEVNYELLPFSTDAAQAMKSDSVKIHEWGNISGGEPSKFLRGNIESGFSEADVVI